LANEAFFEGFYFCIESFFVYLSLLVVFGFYFAQFAVAVFGGGDFIFVGFLYMFFFIFR
jgi:hypothetical protein